MKARIAMFESTKWGGYHSFSTINDEDRDEFGGGEYVRATEYVDVEFPERERGDVIKAQLSALDAEEDKVREDSARKLANIADRRRSLLALTHDTGAAA